MFSASSYSSSDTMSPLLELAALTVGAFDDLIADRLGDFDDLIEETDGALLDLIDEIEGALEDLTSTDGALVDLREEESNRRRRTVDAETVLELIMASNRAIRNCTVFILFIDSVFF